MKTVTIYLKDIPKGYYNVYRESVLTIAPNKVYLVKQVTFGKNKFIKYFFRLPVKDKIYESLITQDFYEAICQDIHFKPEEVKGCLIYEYVYGKDTIRVFQENDLKYPYAIGNADNKEWQLEFQKYHI